jgi:hypothetical protein
MLGETGVATPRFSGLLIGHEFLEMQRDVTSQLIVVTQRVRGGNFTAETGFGSRSNPFVTYDV